jgi:hypothetical protein
MKSGQLNTTTTPLLASALQDLTTQLGMYPGLQLAANVTAGQTIVSNIPETLTTTLASLKQANITKNEMRLELINFLSSQEKTLPANLVALQNLLSVEVAPELLFQIINLSTEEEIAGIPKIILEIKEILSGINGEMTRRHFSLSSIINGVLACTETTNLNSLPEGFCYPLTKCLKKLLKNNAIKPADFLTGLMAENFIADYLQKFIEQQEDQAEEIISHVLQKQMKLDAKPSDTIYATNTSIIKERKMAAIYDNIFHGGNFNDASLLAARTYLEPQQPVKPVAVNCEPSNFTLISRGININTRLNIINYYPSFNTMLCLSALAGTALRFIVPAAFNFFAPKKPKITAKDELKLALGGYKHG